MLSIGVIPLPAAITAIRLCFIISFNFKDPFACEISKSCANDKLFVMYLVKAPSIYVLINKYRYKFGSASLLQLIGAYDFGIGV